MVYGIKQSMGYERFPVGAAQLNSRDVESSAQEATDWSGVKAWWSDLKCLVASQLFDDETVVVDKVDQCYPNGVRYWVDNLKGRQIAV